MWTKKVNKYILVMITVLLIGCSNSSDKVYGDGIVVRTENSTSYRSRTAYYIQGDKFFGTCHSDYYTTSTLKVGDSVRVSYRVGKVSREQSNEYVSLIRKLNSHENNK